MSQWSKYDKTVYDIIGAAMDVHNELNFGLLEPVYQEALVIELKERGYNPEKEVEVYTYYKKQQLQKKYRLDILLNDVVLELKSVSHILPVHRAQLCNYLRLTQKEVGVLINFGEGHLMGERWGYEKDSNNCFLLDRQMEIVCDADYNVLLDYINTDEEEFTYN